MPLTKHPCTKLFAAILHLKEEKILFLMLTYATLKIENMYSSAHHEKIFIAPNKLVRRACYAKCPNLEVN